MTVEIRTFRLPEGTPFLPFYHSFNLSDWFPSKFDRELRPGVVGLGPRKKYSKGEPFPIGIRPPQHPEPCGSRRAWEGNGTPELDPPLVWQLAGPSTCCLPLAEVVGDTFDDDLLLGVGEAEQLGDGLGVGEAACESEALYGRFNSSGGPESLSPGSLEGQFQFGYDLSTDWCDVAPLGGFSAYILNIAGVVDGTRHDPQLVNGSHPVFNFALCEWRAFFSVPVSGQITRWQLLHSPGGVQLLLRRNSSPFTIRLVWEFSGDWDGISPLYLDPVFSDGQWDNSGSSLQVIPYSQDDPL